MTAPTRSPTRRAAIAGLVAVVYAATGYLGLIAGQSPGLVSSVWPASGVAWVAVWMLGGPALPGIWLGSFTLVLLGLVQRIGAPVATALFIATSIATGATLQAQAGVWVVRRLGFRDSPFARPAGVVAFVLLGALASCLLNASIGVGVLALTSHPIEHLDALWMTWWTAEASGVILVAPFVLSWLLPSPARRLPSSPGQIASQLALLVLVAAAVFEGLVPGPAARLIHYLLLPLVLWSALRFRLGETMLGVAFVTVVAVHGTYAGFGPFADLALDPSLIMLQAFLGSLAVTALATSAVVAQREDAEGALLAAEIASREQAEYGQRMSESRLQTVLESLPLEVWMTDAEGRYTYQNPASIRRWGRQLGLRPDQFTDLPEEVGALWVDEDRRALAGELVRSEEVIRKGGVEEFIASVIAPIRDRTGVVGVLGASWDVGELRRAEAALRRSEERFRAAADAGLDSFFLLEALRDPSGTITDFRIVDCNQRFIEMVRRTREQIAGQPLGQLLPFVRDTGLLQTYARVVATGQPSEGEHALDVPELGRRWYQHQVVPVADGVAVTSRDVTARRLAERERSTLEARLRRAEKLESLGVLAGGVAHDFNNLLVGILGNAALLREELAATSPLVPLAEQLQAAATQAADLTRQMLNFTGKGAMELQRVDLSDLAGEVAHLLRSTVARRVEFRLELAEGLPPVEGDPAQLRQIVMNLVLNGAEAIGEGAGVVTLRTRSRLADRALLDATDVHDDLPEGPYVVLEVEDSGHGMDAATRERIFEPFFTTKFTGRGLGLAGVMGMVRSHRGAIKVESVPEAFTRFSILLPAAAPVTRTDSPPVVSPETRGATATLPRGATVLVVDDEPAVRNVAARSLKRAGHEVLAAASGEEALELAREQGHRIDLVLLDLVMPGLSGPETLVQLEALVPGLKVVATSGYAEGQAAARFGSGRPVHFLQKPYRPDELLAVVREALGG
jgi:PAS domain S-box-containing protein